MAMVTPLVAHGVRVVHVGRVGMWWTALAGDDLGVTAPPRSGSAAAEHYPCRLRDGVALLSVLGLIHCRVVSGCDGDPYARGSACPRQHGAAEAA